MGRNPKRSKVESESDLESPEQKDEREIGDDFEHNEEDFIDSEDSLGDGDEAFDSLQDTDGSISDAYTARFPFILKDVYLEARIDPQTRHQTISILKINPESGAVEQKDSHECIHTVVTVLSTDEFADIQSDPDKKEAFLKRTVNLRVRDRAARERGEVFEERGEEEGELFLSIDDQFFAFRSWVQGIAEAGMDAFKVGDEFTTVSQLQEPISSMLFKFLIQRDINFFYQYMDKIVRECRFEGALHKSSLHANLDMILSMIGGNYDDFTEFDMIMGEFDEITHDSIKLNFFIQALLIIAEVDRDFLFQSDRNLLIRLVIASRKEFVDFPEYCRYFTDKDEEVRRVVAENPDAVKYHDYIRFFRTNVSLEIREAVAGNLNAPKYPHYRKMFIYAERYHEIAKKVAINPNAGKFMEFVSLLKHSNYNIRRVAMKHSNANQFSEYKELFPIEWGDNILEILDHKDVIMYPEYKELILDSDLGIHIIALMNFRENIDRLITEKGIDEIKKFCKNIVTIYQKYRWNEAAKFCDFLGGIFFNCSNLKKATKYYRYAEFLRSRWGSNQIEKSSINSMIKDIVDEKDRVELSEKIFKSEIMHRATHSYNIGLIHESKGYYYKTLRYFTESRDLWNHLDVKKAEIIRKKISDLESRLNKDIISYHGIMLPKPECSVLQEIEIHTGQVSIYQVERVSSSRKENLADCPESAMKEDFKSSTYTLVYQVNHEKNNNNGFLVENNHIVACWLGSIGLKCLPIKIDQLEFLELLCLGGNQLEDIPENIGDLESLLYLDVNNNHLSMLPESIGNLRQLKYLDISDNWWDTLPYEITKLRELETLIIDEDFANGLQEIRYFYAWFKQLREKRIHAII